MKRRTLLKGILGAIGAGAGGKVLATVKPESEVYSVGQYFDGLTVKFNPAAANTGAAGHRWFFVHRVEEAKLNGWEIVSEAPVTNICGSDMRLMIKA